jgi:hypothetical protein
MFCENCGVDHAEDRAQAVSLGRMFRALLEANGVHDLVGAGLAREKPGRPEMVLLLRDAEAVARARAVIERNFVQASGFRERPMPPLEGVADDPVGLLFTLDLGGPLPPYVPSGGRPH